MSEAPIRQPWSTGHGMRLGALLAVTLAGLAAVAVSGYYLSQDWAALNAAYARCEKLTMSGADSAPCS